MGCIFARLCRRASVENHVCPPAP